MKKRRKFGKIMAISAAFLLTSLIFAEAAAALMVEPSASDPSSSERIVVDNKEDLSDLTDDEPELLSDEWHGDITIKGWRIVIQYIWHDGQDAPEIHVWIYDADGNLVAHFWWWGLVHFVWLE